MSFEQVGKLVAGVGAFVGIVGAERGDIAAEISKPSAAEQLKQVGPSLAELLQQAVDAAARRLGFMDVVGAKLAEKLDKVLALAIIEPPHHAAMSRYHGTPAQLSSFKGFELMRDDTCADTGAAGLRLWSE